MNTHNALFAAVALLMAQSSYASSVTFQSASSFGPDQPTAAAYQAVVLQALAAPGGHSTAVPLYDGLTSQSLFGGFNNNLALRTTVDFSVSSAQSGNWNLRIGGDFGYGAAVFLDGAPLGFRNTPMWWNFSWADPTQSFQFSGVSVTAGAHRLELFALEDCCDGGQKGMFSMDGINFTTFGTNDGLTSPVPELPSAVLAMSGVAALLMRGRRRRELAVSVE